MNELARIAGAPLNTIWRMERGYGVSLRNAYKVAGAFQLTIYELWSIPPTGSAGNPGEIGFKTVRELRIQRHWRLRDLAQVSGVSKATLTYIEGGHIPTLRNAIRIATALDVSVYQIWNPRSIVKSD